MKQIPLDYQQTLEIIRQQHKELLTQMGRQGEADIKSVQMFLEFLTQSGASIENIEDRSVLHELIRYWSSFINDKTGEFPVVQLQPFYTPLIDNRPPSRGAQGIFNAPVIFESSVLYRRQRKMMLERVRTSWIRGILEQPLEGATFISLGLSERPDLIENPWKSVLQEAEQPELLLSFGTSITLVYDEAESELLILGEPGSGKTTLLLQLARELLDRASLDETHPMPVVFNLSTWAVKRQPLAEWLIEELSTKYQIPQKIGKSWVDTDQMLLLLDGLDEVATEYRAACVGAINMYRQEHGLVSIVVCSRSAEYLALSNLLLLHSAIVVQPLTAQQVDNYLLSAGEALNTLRLALHRDPVLQELVTSPLMLNVLVLANYGTADADPLTVASHEERRRQIFAAYSQRMLQRRGSKTRYTPQQTTRWLAWLARQLVQHNQVEFYLEQMQPDWLSERQLQWVYQYLAVKLPAGLISGLVSLLVFGVVFSPASSLIYGLVGVLIGAIVSRSRTVNSPPGKTVGPWRSIWRNPTNVRYIKNGLIYGLVYALIGGLEYRLSFGLNLGFLGVLTGILFSMLYGEGKTVIQPAEILTWSWKSSAHNLIDIRSVRNGLLVGLSVGLGVGLGVGLIGSFSIGLSYGLSYGLSTGLAFWLLFGLFHGFSSSILDTWHRTKPNQGIWRSMLNGLRIGLISALIGLLGYGLVVGLSYELIAQLGHGPSIGRSIGLSVGLNYWLNSSLSIGLVVGLLSGLLSGGLAYIQHVILHQLLWYAKSIPWNYVNFLDYATERILLHKVGGGYIFVHRLLLEYFASLDTTPTSTELLE